MDNKILANEIMRRVALTHSPEQIAGRLKLDFPDDTQMHISHETIYKIIYAKMNELTEKERATFKLCLRHGNIKRQKRSNKYNARGKIPNTRSIEERPSIVDKKIQLGHWEGDTVEGKDKKGYLTTMVEKVSKFLFAQIATNKKADTIARIIVKMFANVPNDLKKTFTFDNGKEFTLHEFIAELTGADVYFARPYHSWERGLNEHTNGLLRQFFPKKTDLTKITQTDLDKAVYLINNRPRKSLGFKTPAEVFFAQLVALQA